MEGLEELSELKEALQQLEGREEELKATVTELRKDFQKEMALLSEPREALSSELLLLQELQRAKQEENIACEVQRLGEMLSQRLADQQTTAAIEAESSSKML